MTPCKPNKNRQNINEPFQTLMNLFQNLNDPLLTLNKP